MSNGAVAERAKPNTTQPNTPASSESKGQLTLREAVAEVGTQLDERKEVWTAQLPDHITPEKFRGTIITAVNRNLELLDANRMSLINACADAAHDGLLPDGREGALVTFNTKVKVGGQDKWIKKVQWMPMVFGIIKKARQSGEIVALRARIVYENEIEQNRFSYKIEDGIDHIDHDPILFGERGKPCLAYAIAIFKDGTQEIEPLTQGDIAKIRAVSRAKFGPWFDWEEEMWKKSAIRRLCKRLPLSAELFETISRDDSLTDFDALPQPETQSITRAAATMSAGGTGALESKDAGPLSDGIANEVSDGEIVEGQFEEQLELSADDVEAEIANKKLALANIDGALYLNAMVDEVTAFLKKNNRTDLLADFLSAANARAKRFKPA